MRVGAKGLEMRLGIHACNVRITNLVRPAFLRIPAVRGKLAIVS